MNYLSAVFAVFLAAHALVAGEAPRFTVIDVKTITPPGNYNGWGTIALRSSGEIVAAWSGGRLQHVCPFGRVEYMVSRDGGVTWSWPRVLSDSILDDRDAGILETAKGTLLVTTFISEAFEHTEREKLTAAEAKQWERFESSVKAKDHLNELGPRILRSEDGGLNWSAAVPIPVNSPHGPIQLKDGRLLYPGVEDVGDGPYMRGPQQNMGVWESRDDGRTWKHLAKIPARGRDSTSNYHELHGVETNDGRIIVHIRSHVDRRETLQSESSDGGRTWTEPKSIGVYGYPSHLLRLRDGRLLMSHTDRNRPFEIQCRVSSDHGRTWSAPVVLTSNLHSSDMGYPSTVELADGSLVTVWYQVLPESPKAVLRQARWRLE